MLFPRDFRRGSELRDDSIRISRNDFAVSFPLNAGLTHDPSLSRAGPRSSPHQARASHYDQNRQGGQENQQFSFQRRFVVFFLPSPNVTLIASTTIYSRARSRCRFGQEMVRIDETRTTGSSRRQGSKTKSGRSIWYVIFLTSHRIND